MIIMQTWQQQEEQNQKNIYQIDYVQRKHIKQKSNLNILKSF